MAKKSGRPSGRASVREVLEAEAHKNGLGLADYLRGLSEKGMTLSDVGKVWGVSRQAISLVAIAEGVHFDNRRAKLDEAAQAIGFESFEVLVDEKWGEWTQEDISHQLGVSLSTVIRRIKEIEAKAAPPQIESTDNSTGERT